MSSAPQIIESFSKSDRFRLDVHLEPSNAVALARDVRIGLTSAPKWLPPKYFYDAVGSRLFDRICDTPEYYQTRTEQALLERVASEIVNLTEPTHLVELGSGTARKTRVLLGAIERRARRCCYVPFDVSEAVLRESAEQLLGEYPWLEVHGIVGDYDRHLGAIPKGDRRLYVFLGGTIGNFEPEAATQFLASLAGRMHPGDALLLGTDLVKDHARLNAAYNDAQGITAAFNKNVLCVINRELGANFELERFAHVAFFEPENAQIEMHLRSEVDQVVDIQRLELAVPFRAAETIRTEISRKFTRPSATALLKAAGLEVFEWLPSADDAFALSLSRPQG
ncbi:MAG TPA: L-histidine N(alpha)-methyltransferase [Polyangiaceae bacterium]|nr:L-histidine N(alpha)-methyltransferase [Polyangiaceae bacterium]